MHSQRPCFELARTQLPWSEPTRCLLAASKTGLANGSWSPGESPGAPMSMTWSVTGCSTTWIRIGETIPPEPEPSAIAPAVSAEASTATAVVRMSVLRIPGLLLVGRPSLRHHAGHDLGGGLDACDLAHTPSGVEAHRLDVAGRRAVRLVGRVAGDRLAVGLGNDLALVRACAALGAARLLPRPVGAVAKDAVGGAGPAAVEQVREDRVVGAGGEEPLGVASVDVGLGRRQEPGAHHHAVRADGERAPQAVGVGDPPGRDHGDAAAQTGDQVEHGRLTLDVSARLDALGDQDVGAGLDRRPALADRSGLRDDETPGRVRALDQPFLEAP